jgi:hypothetical protein
MADGFGKADEDEQDLEIRQGATLFPVGQALRATYGADNHATLGKQVTALMLQLAQVPFEPHELQPIAPAPAPASAPTPAPPARIGWLARMRSALPGRLHRAHRHRS